MTSEPSDIPNKLLQAVQARLDFFGEKGVDLFLGSMRLNSIAQKLNEGTNTSKLLPNWHEHLRNTVVSVQEKRPVDDVRVNCRRATTPSSRVSLIISISIVQLQ